MIRRIKETFGYGEKEQFRHFGLIIPHTEKQPGASTESGFTEYHYALRMAAQTHLPYATRNIGGVTGAAKLLKKKGCNASLEPHLNAFNTYAEGFEILALEGDSSSIDAAILIAEQFAKWFPDHKIRGKNGVKIIRPTDRGGSNLVKAKKAGMEIALLSEAFFIDNPKDYIDHSTMADFWELVLNN